MVGLDFTKLKRIIFDFDSLNSTQSQGQVFLDFLGINNLPRLVPSEYLSKEMMQSLHERYSTGYGEEN